MKKISKICNRISEFQENSIVTVSEIAAEWLDSVRPFLKESTIVKYQNQLKNHILPAFGSLPVTELGNRRIEAFRNHLLTEGNGSGRRLSPKTVSDLLSLLHAIQRYTAANHPSLNCPLHSVTVRKTSHNMRVLSLSEQNQLCDYLLAHLTPSNLGILLSLFTGIRIGELCALRWKDICLEEKLLYVRHTMQRLQTGDQDNKKTKILISTPKSDCSIRIIPLPEWLAELLRPNMQMDEAFFLTGSPSVFTEPRTMQNRFRQILEDCEIAPANFHALRHTFATRCMEVGFDIKSLSEILGHANVNITLNRYVHPSMKLKRENMSRLSRLITVSKTI